MAASSGRGAWISHFRGRGDLPTRIKKSSITVFDQDGNKINVSLTQGTDATYIDNLSQSHPKDSLSSGDKVKKVVAIRIGDQTYFVSVDDIVKPVSLSNIKLQPQNLCVCFYSLICYLNCFFRWSKNINYINWSINF